MDKWSYTEKPWSVQIELTEGCNKLCSFCSLNAIRTAPGQNLKFMTVDTAKILAPKLAEFVPEKRYEFAMHGEPLTNPDKYEILKIIRDACPKAQIQITTNGKITLKRMQETLEKLFDIGVDFILMDTYYPERDDLWKEAATLKNIRVLDFYKDCNDEKTNPYRNHHRALNRTLILLDDLEKKDGDSKNRVIYNQGGNSPYNPFLKEPLKKTCTLPFRDLTILYNGDVRLCCDDWSGEYTCGNVLENSLEEIWFGDKFNAARKMLSNKRRDFGPCINCNASAGGRSGLLPKDLPLTEEDLKLVRSTEKLKSLPSSYGKEYRKKSDKERSLF